MQTREEAARVPHLAEPGSATPQRAAQPPAPRRAELSPITQVPHVSQPPDRQHALRRASQSDPATHIKQLPYQRLGFFFWK